MSAATAGPSVSPAPASSAPVRYESVIDASGLRTDTCGQQQMAYVNRGNKLTHATFLNIGSNAVYLDDMMSGWEISDSTFINVKGLVK